MKNRMMIPQSVVDHYYDNIYFMVNTNFTYVEAMFAIFAWLIRMKYEVNVNNVTALGTSMLSGEIDKNVKPFINYESIKIRMVI